MQKITTQTYRLTYAELREAILDYITKRTGAAPPANAHVSSAQTPRAAHTVASHAAAVTWTPTDEEWGPLGRQLS